MKKIKKSYRINDYVLEILDIVKNELGINSTSFIEMAVIEKYARIGLDSTKNIQTTNLSIDTKKLLEIAKNNKI